MSDGEIPITIDPVEAANQGKHLQGAIALRQLGRINSLLGQQAGELVVELSFGIDQQGLRYLQGQLRAQVTMTCQRCLNSFDKALTVELKLYPIISSDDLAQLPQQVDALVTQGEAINLHDLLEDEVMVSLPMFAKHDESHCHVKLDEFVTEPQTETETLKPFAGLSELLPSKQQ